MLGAFALGVVAQSSLVLAGLLACWVQLPDRVVGLVAGFGAGALLAAISFDLVEEAQDLDNWAFGFWALLGVAIFLVADRTIERRFGADGGEGGSMGIVVGAVVDGVPESTILGIQLATGFPVSASFVAAVLVSNFAEALAPSADLHRDGWGVGQLVRLWGAVVLACGAAAALGYLAADASPSVSGEGLAALAAGGLLAMLANSLLPFAYERAEDLTGAAVVVGFCLSLAAS